MMPLIAAHPDVEAVYGIFLNTKNAVISIEKLFSGSISGANVYPREIVKRILTLKSNAILLIHNHPSGCTEPSLADFDITFRLCIALEGISVAFHDHIIIGDGYFSMADTGWMEKTRRKIKDLMTSQL